MRSGSRQSPLHLIFLRRSCRAGTSFIFFLRRSCCAVTLSQKLPCGHLLPCGHSCRVVTLAQELPCGHLLHSQCFAEYTRYNYTCPLCSKWVRGVWPELLL
jgi:hypothetical protein